MSCYHPLNMFSYGTHKDKNNKIVQNNIFTDVDTTEIKLDSGEILRNYITIPCGKCIGCRLDYSREWANRCLLEMEDYKSSLFLTLTYDDEHLPRRFYSRLDTGETDLESNPLRKRDFQLFMKRLRKWYSTAREDSSLWLSSASDVSAFESCERSEQLRFFACGEYGDKFGRPHYHAIIFGLGMLRDFEFYNNSKLGFPMYVSKTLENLWQKGYVVIEECTWETCAYTARYIMKKLNGPMSDYYDLNALTPPFVLMSRMPGIGRSYLDRHPEILNFKSISVPSYNRPGNFTVPKYFRRVEKQLDEETCFNRSVLNRLNAEASLQLKLDKVSQKVSAMLESEEVSLKSKTESFKRDW